VGKSAAENGSGEEIGLPVTVAGTLLDGIVLALTPNSHSKSLPHLLPLPLTPEQEIPKPSMLGVKADECN